MTPRWGHKPTKVEPEGYSKEQIVEQLQRDILQFTDLKKKVLQLLVPVSANVQKYGAKVRVAKSEYSRGFYGKKLQKHQKDLLELLSKCTQIDASIKNFKDDIASFDPAPAEQASQEVTA
jgi:dGTP triphosphohydrolase